MHPFIDGNGRVARLMSYAMLREALDTRGLWSVARGLARREARYKQHLAACDMKRRNDMDGRGTLSEEALADFTGFFLQTCIDQVDFMEELMKPERLRDRIMIWTEEHIRAEALPPKSDIVLKAVLYPGRIAARRSCAASGHERARCAAHHLCSAGDRRAHIGNDAGTALSRLPAKFANRWMPGLFPEE